MANPLISQTAPLNAPPGGLGSTSAVPGTGGTPNGYAALQAAANPGSTPKPPATAATQPAALSGSVPGSTPATIAAAAAAQPDATNGYQPRPTAPAATTSTMPDTNVQLPGVASMTGAPLISPTAFDPTKTNTRLGNVQFTAPSTLGAAGYTADQFNSSMPTVSGQAARIMSDGSPILDAARAQAMMTMNDRGLSNSSLAESAGDLATIQSAGQLAGADVANTTQIGLANSGAVNQAAALQAQAENNMLAQTNEGNVQGALNREQALITSDLNSQSGNIQAGLSNQNYNQQGGLNTQTQGNQARIQDQQTADTGALQKQQANLQNIQTARSAAANLSANLSQQINALMQDTNLSASARDAMIAQLQTMYNNSVSGIAKMYGISDINSLQFPDTSTAASTPTPVAGPKPLPKPPVIRKM